MTVDARLFRGPGGIEVRLAPDAWAVHRITKVFTRTARPGLVVSKLVVNHSTPVICVRSQSLLPVIINTILEMQMATNP